MFTNADYVALAWTFAWTVAAVAFHFRVVAKLRNAGHHVPWWRRNRFSVLIHYARVCREQNRSPWPALAPVVVSMGLALPAFLYFMLHRR
jgi:hypothetical protein